MGDDLEINDPNDEIVSKSEVDFEWEPPENYIKRNCPDINSAAVASVRFGVSSTATAPTINGLLDNLVKAHRISEDKKHLI